MRHSIAILSALAGASLAADTIDFYFPGDSEGVDPVASIKAVDPTTTVMHLACPSNIDSSDCGWGIGFDYTIISKNRYQATLSEDTFSMSFGCDNDPAKMQMVCTVDAKGGNESGVGGPQTATLTGSQISFNKATVVAGQNLLTGGSASATGVAASGSGASASVAPKTTGEAMSTSGAKASQSASGSTGPAQSSGAAARFGVEGSATFVILAAVVVGVL